MYLHRHRETEADLHNYAIHRGTSPDLVPGEVRCNSLEMAGWKAPKEMALTR